MPYSPFSADQLLPQEEKLEVALHKSNLFIDDVIDCKYLCSFRSK